MIYGYIRVSTDRQTLQNQRYEIERFCTKENLSIDGWIQETISGTKAPSGRQLGTLLKKVRKGDLIICAELSRLGRSLFMIMEILSLCMHKGCRVWTIKEGYRLGDDIQSKVLAFAFGLSAEIERDLISSRTREALQARKAQGVKLGRPIGARNRHYRLDMQASDIQKLLNQGKTQQEIAEKYGVSRNTVYRWVKRRKDQKNVQLNGAKL